MALVLLVSVVALGVAIPVIYSAVHVVDEGDVEALLVFGEVRAVMQPGIHIVHPFVSEACPIEPSTMRIDTGDRRIPVPDEFRADVRDSQS